MSDDNPIWGCRPYQLFPELYPDEEAFRPIPRFPKYLATSQGRIFSTKSNRFLNLYKTMDGHWQVEIKGKSRLVHRLILEAFIGQCPKGQECCHSDGNGFNNKLNNLRWDTHSSNVRDAVKHRTHVNNRGDNNGMSKLHRLDVLHIYHLCHKRLKPQTEIAKIYGIALTTVSHISNKTTWKHLWKHTN